MCCEVEVPKLVVAEIRNFEILLWDDRQEEKAGTVRITQLFLQYAYNKPPNPTRSRTPARDETGLTETVLHQDSRVHGLIDRRHTLHRIAHKPHLCCGTGGSGAAVWMSNLTAFVR